MADSKPCKFCGSDLKPGASLCPTCNSYQAAWRNYSIYFAGVAGFFALLASAGAFVFSNTRVFLKEAMWNDRAEVIFFESKPHPDFAAVIANTGDGPVFVTEIITIFRGGNAAWRINKRLEVGDFYTTQSTDTTPPEGYGAFVSNSDDRPTVAILNNSAPSFTFGRPCFLETFFSSSSSDLKRMSDFYKQSNRKLVSEPIEAFLYFYSPHFRTLRSVHLPMVVTFQRSSEDRCKNIN
jgi:hypothetical protein